VAGCRPWARHWTRGPHRWVPALILTTIVGVGADDGRATAPRPAPLTGALLSRGWPAGLEASGAPLTGRVLVTLAGSGGLAAGVAGRAGARLAGTAVPELRLFTVRASTESLPALLSRLRSDPRVRSAQSEFRFAPRFVPSDPALTLEEHTGSPPPGTVLQWWAQREGLYAAWDVSRGDGATVAVVDTGVDGTHPELSAKLRAAVNLDSTPGHGPATVDESGHGTHVSSIACATSDNGAGPAGAGLNCGLIVEKTDFSVGSVVQAIVDATNRGADAINLSFGADGSQPTPQALIDAIDYAYAHGVVLVAAAADAPVTEQGPPANVLAPAGTAPGLGRGRGLVVTAAGFDDRRSSQAGYGSEVSLAAYGAFAERSGPPGLLGAFPRQPTTIDTGTTGSRPVPPCGCRQSLPGDPATYAYLSGTSIATPAVTATAALVRHLNPDLRVSEILAVIEQTARRAPGGWTPDLGWGILDAGGALDRARRIDHRPPRSHVRAPRHARPGVMVLRLGGRDRAPAGLIASGVAYLDVYRRVDRGQAERIARTGHARLRTRVRAGHRYAFYSLAVDRAGNRETVPAHSAMTSVRSR
jgi:hypothetical protein